MKKLLAVLSFSLFAVAAVAQPPVVSQASKLAWDDPNEPLAVTKFRIYIQETPVVVPDGVSFVAEIAGSTSQPMQTYEWLIASGIGSHWAVVTAVNDVGPVLIETGPSNEFHYVVIGPPRNLRIVTP